MPDDAKPPVLNRRGGIWGIVGFALIAGIVIVGVMKYLDPAENEPKRTDYTPPRHLIVISIDTLRADHLGCYGYDKKTSPNIDALAKEGVMFERHYANYPLTLPAHLTQLTGVSTLGHRVRDNLYHNLPAELDTLAEVMHEQDFRTGGFVSAHAMKAGSGIERGFEVYDDKDVRTLEPGRLTIRERKAPETLKLAEEWIAGLGSDRFFCFIHLFDPHAPYEPHPDLGDGFQGSDTARYDGEIAFTDRAIGRFILRLEELGLMKDTLLVITSDHGEGLGEHDELTHGYYCYDATTHVPLIIHGAPGFEAGTRVPGIARNYDLTPTLVELMGLEGKEFGKQFHGISLAPAMCDPATDMNLTAYIESHYAWLNCNWAKIRGLRTNDALTLFSGDEVLHLTGEGQKNNAPAENGKAVSAARAEIERLLNSWMPPSGAASKLREPGAGSPYPGESPVAQNFEAEKINDTRNLPSPHQLKHILRAYQDAELAYDAGRFEVCAEKLRALLKQHDDFIMAHRLLAAVNQGIVQSEHNRLGVARCKELILEAATSLKHAIAVSERHDQDSAADSVRRNLALMLVWVNDTRAVSDLAEASDDPAVKWMYHLVSYRVAHADMEDEVVADAGKFLATMPPSTPIYADAQRDYKRMQSGEPLPLAPWEQ